MMHTFVMVDVKNTRKFVVCVRVRDGSSTIVLWKNIKSAFKWNIFKFYVNKNNISVFKSLSLCTIFQVLGQYLVDIIYRVIPGQYDKMIPRGPSARANKYFFF